MMRLFSGLRLHIFVNSNNWVSKVITKINDTITFNNTFNHCHSSIMIEKTPFRRLPSDVVPEIYDIFIKPNLKTFTFHGKETIQLKVLRSINKIILHAVDLKIDHASLLLKSTNTVLDPVISISNEDETLTLQFDSPIPVDSADLNITFKGELNDKLKGFYRSKCIGLGDEEKYCAVTQFEATDARRCFPCWDEPAIKARFDITLAVDKNVKVALSNMPVKDEKLIGEEKIVKFERTPVMSTYLVAMVVGDFDYVEDTSSDGILVRVYTPVGKKDQGKFALHVATKVLPYYKDYFQIAYPLPKMDLIAIADISSGAMENWGLVTYREAYLLVDKTNTSAVTKQFVALVVGHELAHQWFGNLVTMEWWTHLWLNEGYASFVEFLCVDYLFPEYDIWTQFATDMYCRALELDALNNSHPIEIPVGHPSEVEEIFDDISYNKGASVIRMLHRYLGDNDFRKGMNLYLSRHQYSNTFTEDLWDALQEASSKPVKAVMSTWTKQKGFPIVTVEDCVQETDNERTFTVSQTKFSTESDKSEDNLLWFIPLSFSSSKVPDKECYTTILTTPSAKITVPNISADEWVKLNPNSIGYYRTKYPPHLLDQFVNPIKKRTLPPLDRLGLLDDLFALIPTGLSSTVDVLKFIQAMAEEDNYTVWTNISSCLVKIHILLYNTDFDDLFVKYALRIVKPISEKLGYEPKSEEGHLDILLRSLILNKLFQLNDVDYIEYAKIKFIDYCNGTSTIPADLRVPIYKAALCIGGREAYNSILKLIQETDLQEEKDRLIRSFTAIVDEDIIKDALQFLISGKLAAQNTVIGIVSIALSKYGRNLALDFVKENWNYLQGKYQGGFLLSRVVKYTAESFASEEKAQEIESFFSGKKIDGVERTIRQSVETIRNNASWLERDKDSIYEFLKSL